MCLIYAEKRKKLFGNKKLSHFGFPKVERFDI